MLNTTNLCEKVEFNNLSKKMQTWITNEINNIQNNNKNENNTSIVSFSIKTPGKLLNYISNNIVNKINLFKNNIPNIISISQHILYQLNILLNGQSGGQSGGLCWSWSCLYDWLADKIKSGFDLITSPFTAIWDGLKWSFDKLYDGFLVIKDSIKSWATYAFNGIISILSGIVGAITSAVSGIASAVGSTISSIFNSMWEGVKYATGAVIGGISKAIRKAINYVTGWIDGIRKKYNAFTSEVGVQKLNMILCDKQLNKLLYNTIDNCSKYRDGISSFSQKKEQWATAAWGAVVVGASLWVVKAGVVAIFATFGSTVLLAVLGVISLCFIFLPKNHSLRMLVSNLIKEMKSTLKAEQIEPINTLLWCLNTQYDYDIHSEIDKLYASDSIFNSCTYFIVDQESLKVYEEYKCSRYWSKDWDTILNGDYDLSGYKQDCQVPTPQTFNDQTAKLQNEAEKIHSDDLEQEKLN